MVAIARQYKRELERKDALLLTLTSANSQALYNAAVVEWVLSAKEQFEETVNA